MTKFGLTPLRLAAVGALFAGGAAVAWGLADQGSDAAAQTAAATAETAAVSDLDKWEIHDMSRPKPAVIDPGTASTQEEPGKPPSDATVLFDGKDLSAWSGAGPDGAATWTVENGYASVGGGGISTKEAFGDCQLHIEWSAPEDGEGEGQGRSNSGVYLMGMYEVQVLDSYNNETYADGQAAALYGQYPPLVNAMRPPGQWNVYDIIFHRPRFDADGKVLQPARVTVLHNGVLVQDNSELTGPSGHHQRPPYTAHPDKLPISLQDHGQPVRYRNIWIRSLEKEQAQEQPAAGEAKN